jgi:hypothetical protein
MRGAATHVGLLQQPGALSSRFALTEIAGAFGDLGTFIPIVVGMTQIGGPDAGTVLVFADLANILAGLALGMPMAVQPMKAIAALAIAGQMGEMEVCTAGHGRLRSHRPVGPARPPTRCAGLADDRRVPALDRRGRSRSAWPPTFGLQANLGSRRRGSGYSRPWDGFVTLPPAAVGGSGFDGPGFDRSASGEAVPLAGRSRYVLATEVTVD